MRPEHFRKRQRAWNVALAVSCASSLQLSGCLNNSRLELVDDASKAALRAEQDVAQRRRDEAARSQERLAQMNPFTDDTSGVQLAGAEEDAKQAAGESTAAAPQAAQPERRGFFKRLFFWRSDEKDAEQAADASGTPTQHEPPARTAAKTVSQAISRDVTTEPVAQPNSAQETIPEFSLPEESAVADSVTPPDERSTVDDWFEQQFSGALQESAQDSAVAAAETEDAVPDEAAQTDTSDPFSTFGRETAEAAPQARPFPTKNANPVSDDGWPATASSTAQTDQARAFVRVEESTFDAPAQATSSAAATRPAAPADAEVTERFEAAAMPASDTNHVKPSVEDLARQQQALRVKALISAAHTHIIRGELHAAYRSALLAQKIADESQLKFEIGEETPGGLARSIASRIWKDSDSPQAERIEPSKEVATASVPQGASATAATAEPNLSTPSVSLPASSAAVWGQPLNTWTALDPVSDSTASKSASLPQIQSGLNGSSVANAPRSTGQPQARKPLSGMTSTAPGETPSTQDEQGVEFAIAHSLAKDGTSQELSTASQAPTLHPAPMPPLGTNGQTASQDDPQSARPPLLAPPVTGREISLGEAPSSWESLMAEDQAARQAAAPAESGSYWKLIWSLIGMGAAAFSVLMGLRLTRLKRAEATVASQPVSESSEAASEDKEGEQQYNLRIKRAA